MMLLIHLRGAFFYSVTFIFFILSAYATVLRPSSVWNVLWLNGAS